MFFSKVQLIWKLKKNFVAVFLSKVWKTDGEGLYYKNQHCENKEYSYLFKMQYMLWQKNKLKKSLWKKPKEELWLVYGKYVCW